MSHLIEKKLPQECPSCQSKLSVKKLSCPQCHTEVDGLFTIPTLASFSQDDQAFVINFIRSSGSLKDMAKIMGLSYPTVRNYLDDVIEKINRLEKIKTK